MLFVKLIELSNAYPNLPIIYKQTVIDLKLFDAIISLSIQFLWKIQECTPDSLSFLAVFLVRETMLSSNESNSLVFGFFLCWRLLPFNMSQNMSFSILRCLDPLTILCLGPVWKWGSSQLILLSFLGIEINELNERRVFCSL